MWTQASCELGVLVSVLACNHGSSCLYCSWKHVVGRLKLAGYCRAILGQVVHCSLWSPRFLQPFRLAFGRASWDLQALHSALKLQIGAQSHKPPDLKLSLSSLGDPFIHLDRSLDNPPAAPYEAQMVKVYAPGFAATWSVDVYLVVSRRMGHRVLKGRLHVHLMCTVDTTWKKLHSTDLIQMVETGSTSI